MRIGYAELKVREIRGKKIVPSTARNKKNKYFCITNIDVIMTEIIYKKESYEITRSIYDVYNILGNGFLESVYHEVLEYELSKRGIPFVSKPEIKIHYRDIILQHTFIPDIVCYDKIILELKSVSQLMDAHIAQIMNYLKASGIKLGMLVNFGERDGVVIKRIVL